MRLRSQVRKNKKVDVPATRWSQPNKIRRFIFLFFSFFSDFEANSEIDGRLASIRVAKKNRYWTPTLFSIGLAFETFSCEGALQNIPFPNSRFSPLRPNSALSLASLLLLLLPLPLTSEDATKQARSCCERE